MTYRIISSSDPIEFANEITAKLAEGFQFMSNLVIHEHGDKVVFVREMMRDSSVKAASAPQIRSLKQ